MKTGPDAGTVARSGRAKPWLHGQLCRPSYSRAVSPKGCDTASHIARGGPSPVVHNTNALALRGGVLVSLAACPLVCPHFSQVIGAPSQQTVSARRCRPPPEAFCGKGFRARSDPPSRTGMSPSPVGGDRRLVCILGVAGSNPVRSTTIYKALGVSGDTAEAAVSPVVSPPNPSACPNVAAAARCAVKSACK